MTHLSKGFTLIELLVVVGIIGILATVVIVAVNPGRQFAASRDVQRRSDLNGITNAIYQYVVEHNGLLPTEITTVPTTIGTGVGMVNLGTVLTPTYISAIPRDPSNGTDADTNYTIFRNVDNRVIASATSEVNPGVFITVSR